MSRWWALPATGLGLIVGTAAVAVHRHTLWIDDVGLPWGGALAVAASAATGIGLRGSPPAVVGYVVGWCLLVVAVFVLEPGGSYVYANDLRGMGFLLAGVAAMAVVVAVGGRERPGRTR